MTRDEIFAAMEAAYTGAGSLAGDILRACADGCAELWSTEIDGLEERAFVASAAGEWLTRVCADRGISRREGEDDEALRARALEGLRRQGASGNADDYAEWCGAVADILRMRVLPLARSAGACGREASRRRGRQGDGGGRKAAEHRRERRSERGGEP